MVNLYAMKDSIIKDLDDSLRGGRGKCPLCNEWHSNVAYHTAHECKKRKEPTEKG